MNLNTGNYETAGFIEWTAPWNAKVTWGIETVRLFRKKQIYRATCPILYRSTSRIAVRKKRRQASKWYLYFNGVSFKEASPHASAKITPV
jgi:hypothetical protein